MKAIQMLATPAHAEQALEKLRQAYIALGVSLAIVRDFQTPQDSDQPDTFHLTDGITMAQIDRRLTLPELYNLSEADLFICLNTDAPEIAALEVGADFSEDWHPAALAQMALPDKARLKDGRAFALPEETTAFARALWEVGFAPLPGLNCGKCGRKDCASLRADIVQGRATRGDCRVASRGVTLEVDGRRLPMVDFVERILHNVVVGIAKEMKSYGHPRRIQITIRPEDGADIPSETDAGKA